MKITSLIVIAALFAYSCTSSTAGVTKKQAFDYSRQSKKVLLELFTSQGCSSCPPADKLVSSLAQADSNLVVVSFHVDYWDRLGWKDIYSNHDYTARQQQFEQTLHTKYVYTPQAVVQGQYEMTGSNQPGILNAVKVVSEEDNNINIGIEPSMNDRSVSVSYKLDKKLPAACQIYAVLVQNKVMTSVTRGENSGRQLSGYHVARSMKSMPLTKEEDAFQLMLADDLKPSDFSVIVFIQSNSSGKIMGVNEVAL